jgi:cytosine permease
MTTTETVVTSEDFVRDKVPDAATISPFRIIVIMLGVSIALPAFIMGAQLGSHLGLRDTFIACALGGAILSVVAAISGIAGAISRVSSYVLIIEAFGQSGGKLINALIGCVALGLFGLVAMMFGSTLRATGLAWADSVSALSWSLGGCVIFTITTIIGFRAIDRLSQLVTPLKILLLVWTVVASIRQAGHLPAWRSSDASWPTFSHWSSFVVGGMITGATLAPDLTRYVRTPLKAIVAGVGAFGVAGPLVLFVASIPGVVTGQQDLIALMVALGLGLPALAIIILATWTTASFNLYAAALTFATVSSTVPRWRLTLIAGIIGSAFGLLGISERIVPFLLVLSIAIPPIGGVYLSRFYLNLLISKRRAGFAPQIRTWHPLAFLACIAGTTLAGLADRFGWQFTTFPSIDSILVASAVYIPLQAYLMTRPSALHSGKPSLVINEAVTN